MLNSSNFKMHIESKDRITKQERANHLYSQYTFDTALPQDWVNSVVIQTGRTHEEVVSQFVWLYFDHSSFGQPAPLSLDACDTLFTFEESQDHYS